MAAAVIRWHLFPLTSCCAEAKEWLDIQLLLGLAVNTVEAYGRGLEQFLAWCSENGVAAISATRPSIACYVGYLRSITGKRN